MRLFNIIFGGISLILLALGGYSYWQETQFLKTAYHVTGTVTDLDMNDNSYCPVIEFKTQEGKPVRFYGNVCSNPPAYDIGQKVELAYDTPEVNKVQMTESFFSKYGGAVIFGFIGGLFLVIWIFFMGAATRDYSK